MYTLNMFPFAVQMGGSRHPFNGDIHGLSLKAVVSKQLMIYNVSGKRVVILCPRNLFEDWLTMGGDRTNGDIAFMVPVVYDNVNASMVMDVVTQYRSISMVDWQSMYENVTPHTLATRAFDKIYNVAMDNGANYSDASRDVNAKLDNMSYEELLSCQPIMPIVYKRHMVY